jgi:hypothetical protein
VVSRADIVEHLQSKSARSRLVALATVLALLTLITISGPHFVHHLVEQYPHGALSLAQAEDSHQMPTTSAPADDTHHAQAHPHPARPGHPPDGRPSPWSDCLILFLLQYIPVVALALACVTVLAIVILLTSTGHIWLSPDHRSGFHIRAPPA